MANKKMKNYATIDIGLTTKKGAENEKLKQAVKEEFRGQCIDATYFDEIFTQEETVSPVIEKFVSAIAKDLIGEIRARSAESENNLKSFVASETLDQTANLQDRIIDGRAYINDVLDYKIGKLGDKIEKSCEEQITNRKAIWCAQNDISTAASDLADLIESHSVNQRKYLGDMNAKLGLMDGLVKANLKSITELMDFVKDNFEAYDKCFVALEEMLNEAMKHTICQVRESIELHNRKVLAEVCDIANDLIKGMDRTHKSLHALHRRIDELTPQETNNHNQKDLLDRLKEVDERLYKKTLIELINKG